MEISNIKFIALFIEGILSFFSPCIIPIIPIYITMLCGKKEYELNGEIKINKKSSIINSIFFILGISTTFFIIAFATSYIGNILNSNIKIIQIFSGILIIIMGLLQLGIFNIPFLKREFSLKRKFKYKNVNFLVAFLMGFTFSFSWTPCIGPIMASVFLYASTHTGLTSFMLVLTYSIGFILPFILTTIFATKILTIIKTHPKIIHYTVIISGIILILIGLAIITGDFQKLAIKYFM